MLYLTRRTGEAVIINNSIEVRVIEVRGRTVKLGLTFPPDVTVLREEVYEQIRESNLAAARSAEDWPSAVPRLSGRDSEP
jgi:carbon storage regulator